MEIRAVNEGEFAASGQRLFDLEIGLQGTPLLVNPPLGRTRTACAPSGTSSKCRGGRASTGKCSPPLDREADQVLEDVLDGFVSVEAAQSSHGVVIDPVTVVVDQRGTAMRKDLEISRGPTKLFHRFNYFDTAEEGSEWMGRKIPR